MTVRALATVAAPVVVATVALLAGCDRAPLPDADLYDAHKQGHVHEAPHGGTLLALAEESANLELVHDAAAGKLTAYVLDGHAESGLRVAQPSLALSVRRGTGAPIDVTLEAVANPLTGEKSGDSSEFSATDERLRGAGPLEGTVILLRVRGEAFSEVPFRLAEAGR